ncbi:MAG: hypothetical protein AAF587_31870 [Bacteroidota bacterium]
MNQTTLRSIPLGICLWLVSFSLSSAQLAQARSDVLARYPESHYFIQSYHPNLIQFNFVSSEKASCAIYSLDGDWLGTISRISPSSLPLSVRQELTSMSSHPVQAAYQIRSCITFGPVYTSFIKLSPQVQTNTISQLPPFAVAGVTVWVASMEEHQGYLVNREGIHHLNLSDSHFIGLLHHGSGRGLASQEVSELLEAFLIPFPTELTPTAYSLPHTIGSLKGWYPSIAWK